MPHGMNKPNGRFRKLQVYKGGKPYPWAQSENIWARMKKGIFLESE